jgi:cytochrome c-type biogenesis protein CcmH/NrfG
LRCDPNNASAWVHLCRIFYKEKIVVNGVERTQRDCYLEALRIDPDNSEAWRILGRNLTSAETIVVNGVERTHRDCLVEALRKSWHDPQIGSDHRCQRRRAHTARLLPRGASHQSEQ